jgi:beta-glucanase (GH16 family)
MKLSISTFTLGAALLLAANARSATLLIDVNFCAAGGATQTGAAVLGDSGDRWNSITGPTNTLVDSTGNIVGGVGLALNDSGDFLDAGGTAMDAATTALMEDCIFGNGSTVTVSLTGLASYKNDAFTLVIYGAGDTSGQGDTLNITAGAKGGNSGSSLATSASPDRKISEGIGVAYQTYTGIIDAGTITFTATGRTQYAIVNGFQLQLRPPPNPGILASPDSQIAYIGDTVSFNVSALGTAPFSYQWQATDSATDGFTNLTDGGPISGATSNVLTITSVTTNWADAYRVIVSNASGSVTSSPPAILKVLTIPVITSQPASQMQVAGNPASFIVAAIGASTISYQWQATNPVTGGFTNLLNGGNISGATSNVLTITNVTANGSLAYQVILTNHYGAVTSTVATLTVPTGWHLVWNDEFNGTTLDATKWTPYVGNDTGGNVYYTDRTNNVYVANGLLHLVAQKESLGGFSYTSGQVRTEFKYWKKYGLIMARMRMPAGQGFWPAFWMLGRNYDPGIHWPYCGEIDVPESHGGLTNMVQGTIHYADVSGNDTFQTSKYTLPSGGFTTDFHNYGIEWTTNSIIWQVDGVNVQTWTNWGLASGSFAYPEPFNQPFFFLLQLAVGSASDYGGLPDATTPFPSEVQVDYVRVYDQMPLPPTGLVATGETHEASLNWAAVSEATSYRVKRATVSGGPYTTVANSPTPSYMDTNIVVGTTYFYVVSAVGAWGESGDSTQVNLTFGPTLLVNGDLGSGATQTGAAVLGSPRDVWNAIATGSGTLVDSASNTLNGVGFTLVDQGLFIDTNGTAMDAVTTPLMEDYAYGNTSPATVTLHLTGLTKYLNDNFSLVVYAAGDTSGQGALLTLAGATGGNSTSTLTTTAASRQIYAGLGVAYNEFTGILTNGTLTLTASPNGSAFTSVNGFQLQINLPTPR